MGRRQPGDDEENRFLERHDLPDYALWHLAEDPEAGEDTRAATATRTATSGASIAAASWRRGSARRQNDHSEVERAAGELLELLDETAA
jgi:hypothetical protein